MRPFMQNMSKQVGDFFRKMEKKARIRFTLLVMLVIVFAIVIVVVLNRTKYEVLVTTQSQAEAGEVYTALQTMNVPAKVEGTSVLVPDNRASELRVVLASQGLFSNEVNYDWLDQASGFSTTEDVRKKMLEITLGSEIRAAILMSDKIQDARVNVTLGKTSAFALSRSAQEPICSVTLMIRSGATLSNQEAQTIAEIVRTSVPGIKYEYISITDSKLNYYQVGDGNVDLGVEIQSRIAMENLLKQQMQQQIEQLLTPIYNAYNVKVQPFVVLDFDSINIEKIEFSPPIPGEMDGIVRSSSELWELQRVAGVAEGIPGTDTNGMGSTEYPYGTLSDGEEYKKALIEKNYEIDQTITTIEKARGTIRELSISVLINSDAVEGDFTDQVTNLVSKAIGCRVENIAVERVPFAYREKTMEEIAAEWEEIERQTRMRELMQTIIIWAVILILGLAFMALIRSIVKSVKEPEPQQEAATADAGTGTMVDYTAGGYAQGMYGQGGYDQGMYGQGGYDQGMYGPGGYDQGMYGPGGYDQGMYAGQDGGQDPEIELNTKSPGLEQIEKFIDKDPGAVAQLLRNWLSDED